MPTSVIARKASIVPSVTMKEGIRVVIKSTPLTAPSMKATKIASIAAGIGSITPKTGAPLVIKFMKESAVTPKIEPTDKSNSPEIIK